jgi:hypothetical protein
MRSVKAFAVALTLVFTACAGNTANTKGAPVNVAAVRSEIKDTLHGDRAILSMGHVEHDKAVVFTEGHDKARHQETWVRDANGAWTMSATVVVAGN